MTRHIVFHIPQLASMTASTPTDDVKMPVPETAAPRSPHAERVSNGAHSACPVPDVKVSDGTLDEDPTSEVEASESESLQDDDSKSVHEDNQSGRNRSKTTFFEGASHIYFGTDMTFGSIDGNATFHTSRPGPFSGRSFGPNSNSFARQSAPRTRTGPTQGPSATAGSSSSNTRRGNQDNRNATLSSTSSGSGNNAFNPFAAFGGDMYGNGASGLTISNCQIIHVGGRVYDSTGNCTHAGGKVYTRRN